LGNLGQMTWLWLFSNRLTGEIPFSFGNLANLLGLNLRGNQLSGGIPSSLGNLTKLKYLMLHYNQLTGPIPDSLKNLVNLNSLFVNSNQLTGVPSSLSNLTNTNMVLLPNPMSLPYDLIVKNPVSTMNAQNLTDFLKIGVKAKREMSSTVATLTTKELLAMCQISFVEKQDILAGCFAGITYFCKNQMELTQCQNFYDTVFLYSIFKTIGANCPAWKYGPRSSNCNDAVNDFNVKLEYTTINKEFATFFARTLFTNKEYAPCNSTVQKCIW